MELKIAIAGNPNCGKTTLFNLLTGSNQYVGNWPGVTVEKKEGKSKFHKDVIFIDLPGIYSLSPYTLEEVVARNYLINERPDAILNIVDGTNLERNLYLTTQMIEIGIPVVIAINMMDIIRKRGDKIDIDVLSKKIKCKIVEISALKGTGIEEAANLAIEAANQEKTTLRHYFSGAVEHAIAHIEEAAIHDMPSDRQRWYAIKIFERDEKVIKQLKIPKKVLEHIEGDILSAEAELDDDAESIIANERYNYIASVLKECYFKKNTKKISLSDKIDLVLTNRFLALPIFVAIMFLIYYISISTVGTWATDFVNNGIFGKGWHLFGIDELYIPGIPDLVSSGLNYVGCADWLQNLILNGIISGVGSVLGFVPQLLVLFLFLAFLEGCGYMSRIAFVLDKIFRKFGLSGKSFIPILIGTGCGVPGIMASRTIENEQDRRMTIITTTFIPCGAKIPVIALIASALFGGAWWIAPSAYFIGIISIIVSGIILKKTKLFLSEPSPFVMELPSYHMPTLINVLRSMWERGWSFIKKAGTVILISAILLWFLQSFGFEQGVFGMVKDINHSILATLGNFVAWIFTPLGFGDWKCAVASMTGIIAKENVVNTFGVLLGGFSGASESGWQIASNMQEMFTPLQGYSFLMFNLLCAPCIAAIAAIRSEMKSGKWTLFAIGYQTAFAYIISLIIYQFGLMFSGNINPLGMFFAAVFAVLILYMLFRPQKSIQNHTSK